MIKFNLDSPHVVATMQDSVFIDIETSLVNARIYRPGTQFVGAHQVKQQYSHPDSCGWNPL